MRHTTRRRTTRQTRKFHIPEDLRESSFSDAFVDVFTPPEALVLRRPDYGFMARIRDGLRIRKDVHKAAMDLGIETDVSDS